MTDQPADRISLRTIPTREDRMAAATAETTDSHATCHDRDTCAERTREVVDALTRQRDNFRAHRDSATAAYREVLEARDDLRAQLDQTRAGAHALEAERDDLRIALRRADAETRAMVRDRDEVIRERDQARATVTAVEREHGETLEQLSQAWAALNQAGTTGPGSVAEHIAQLAEARDKASRQRDSLGRRLSVRFGELEEARAARRQAEDERDTARHLVDVRTAALARRTEQRDQLIADLTDAGNEVDLAEADARRLRRALTAVRDGVELIDRALSTVDAAPAQTATERPNGTGEGTDKGDGATEALRWLEADDDAADERDDCERLADAMERAETVRIDSRDVIWRPTSGGQWQHPLYGYADADELEAEHGPTRQALLLNIDEQDETDDAPPPGSGPARAQDGLLRQRDLLFSTLGEVLGNFGEQGQPGIRTGWVREDTFHRWHGVLAGVVAADDVPMPESIRPADWEQRAVTAARDALSAAWPNLGAGAVAEVAVRAIIDAGLAGPGGRCPACGQTYPRTPDPADPRCWTCSSEPDPAEIAEHRPGVTALLAQIRHEAAEVQAAALADPDGDHMGPAYPANTHDHSTGYPLFAPDAELIVGTSDGPQPWTGTEWNEHVRWAARARNGVTERLVTCPTSVCTTTCPANPDRIDL